MLGDAIDEGIAVGSSAPRRLRRLRRASPATRSPTSAASPPRPRSSGWPRGLGRDDVLLVLISGGASALLPAPAAAVPLDEKAALTSALMRAGASIHELNIVRKHLSRLKGGGLARAAAPARVVALVLSDVVGDDLGTIASGPVVPDPTTYAGRARRARGARRAATWRPRPRATSRPGPAARSPETPKPGAPLFRRVTTRGHRQQPLDVEAAAREARRLGLRPLVLTTSLEGEARDVAPALVSDPARVRGERARPRRPPCACSPAARRR